MYAQGLLKVKIESTTSTTVSAMNMVGDVEPCTRSCCWVQLQSLLAWAETELADDLTQKHLHMKLIHPSSGEWTSTSLCQQKRVFTDIQKGIFTETWCFFHRSTNLDLFHIVMCLVDFFIRPRWEQIDLVAWQQDVAGFVQLLTTMIP